MKLDYLHLVVPEVTQGEPPKPPPWWLAPEFLALGEVRRAVVGSTVSTAATDGAEQSAREAVSSALFEIEHIVREMGKRIEAGDSVRLLSEVYRHTADRAELDLRIVEDLVMEGDKR